MRPNVNTQTALTLPGPIPLKGVGPGNEANPPCRPVMCIIYGLATPNLDSAPRSHRRRLELVLAVQRVIALIAASNEVTTIFYAVCFSILWRRFCSRLVAAWCNRSRFITYQNSSCEQSTGSAAYFKQLVVIVASLSTGVHLRHFLQGLLF